MPLFIQTVVTETATASSRMRDNTCCQLNGGTLGGFATAALLTFLLDYAHILLC